MQRLQVNEAELIACPLRADAPEECDRIVTFTFCEGCNFHGGALRGGGGAASMAPVGATPTAAECNYQRR